MNNEKYLEKKQLFAEMLAEEAGEFAKRYFLNLEKIAVETKNPRDFVSEADRLVEEYIIGKIKSVYPDDNIVGEEGGGSQSGSFWCIDPIDGTSNFLAGIPFWGVSIGFVDDGLPILGAISIPMLDILVSASTAKDGIRYNKATKKVRKSTAIPTVALGQSPYWENESFRNAQDIFLGAELECMNYRCSVIGTVFASLGLTHGYYEENSNMWDVAAGYIIAKQSGLKASIHHSKINDHLTICVLTDSVHNQIKDSIINRQSTYEGFGADI